MEGEFLDKPMGLIDCILTANYTAESLKALYDQAIKGDLDLEMEDGLFLYQERLIVLDINNL